MVRSRHGQFEYTSICSTFWGNGGQGDGSHLKRCDIFLKRRDKVGKEEVQITHRATSVVRAAGTDLRRVAGRTHRICLSSFAGEEVGLGISLRRRPTVGVVRACWCGRTAHSA